MIKTKRIYEPVNANDGYRILVDRLWPRGISKEKAQIDRWVREIAPSTELRKWFAHQPERFSTFQKEYKKEIENDPIRLEILAEIRSKLLEHPVTLLYAAKDERYNHAVVLCEFLRNNM